MPAANVESVQNTWISLSLSNSHVPVYGPIQHSFMYGVTPPRMVMPYTWPPVSNNSPISALVISPYEGTE